MAHSVPSAAPSESPTRTMPTIFQKITDLTPSTVLNGTERIEMVHNPGGPEEQSQSVTPNQLAAFVGQSGNGVTMLTVLPEGVTPNKPGVLVFVNDGTNKTLWLKETGMGTTGYTQLI